MTGWIIAAAMLTLVSVALVVIGRIPRTASEINAAAL